MWCVITNSFDVILKYEIYISVCYDKLESIKAVKRARRVSSSGIEIKIAGPDTPIPKKCDKYIKNLVNKVHCLADSIQVTKL